MSSRATGLILFVPLVILLSGCSQRITGPEAPDWQVVPCEYKLQGDDQSVLVVRACIAEFDSAKAVTHTLCWTVLGDTLSHQTTLYPREQEKSENHAIFTFDRSLPINSVLKSVELFIKKSPQGSRRKRRL